MRIFSRSVQRGLKSPPNSPRGRGRNSPHLLLPLPKSKKRSGGDFLSFDCSSNKSSILGLFTGFWLETPILFLVFPCLYKCEAGQKTYNKSFIFFTAEDAKIMASSSVNTLRPLPAFAEALRAGRRLIVFIV